MADIETLQATIALETFSAMPGGDWGRVVVSFLSAGRMAESRCRVVASDGRSTSVKTPAKAVYAYADLREAMAGHGHGAWFSSSMTLDRGGHFDFAFDYVSEPRWGVRPTDDALLADLAAHPRPESEVPQWHPAYQPEPAVDPGMLQATIARETYRAAPTTGWRKIVLTYRSVGSYGEADSVALSAAGERTGIGAPTAAILAYRDLRKVTANARQGAWFTSTMTVGHDGDFEFTFDYDARPQWAAAPDDAALLADLAKHPRPESAVPPWHPGHPDKVGPARR
jgi:hypothetical protein